MRTATVIGGTVAVAIISGLIEQYLGLDRITFLLLVLTAFQLNSMFTRKQKQSVVVGVVTPTEQAFREWMTRNGKKGEIYVWVSSEEDLEGLDRVVPGLGWETMGDLYFKACRR